jgi:hypothetical protein
MLSREHGPEDASMASNTKVTPLLALERERDAHGREEERRKRGKDDKEHRRGRILLLASPRFLSYSGRLGIAVAVGWSAILVAGLGAAAEFAALSSFTSLGPNEEASFGGIVIDNWAKWAALMGYSCLSQLAQSIVEGTLSPYVTNVLRDPTVPCSSYWEAQVIVAAEVVFLWMVALFDILLYITMQLQFWLPAIVADVAVNIYLTHWNFRGKAQHMSGEDDSDASPARMVPTLLVHVRERDTDLLPPSRSR